MKLNLLLLFAGLALANPIAKPFPGDDIAAPNEGALDARQIGTSCTVRGRAGLDVCIHCLAFFGLGNWCGKAVHILMLSPI